MPGNQARALKLRGSVISTARKLAKLVRDEDWYLPLTTYDAVPYVKATALARDLDEVASGLERDAARRKKPTREPSLATTKAVYSVMELRLATGGKMENRCFPFPVGGKPFYSVSSAFLDASGIRGMSPVRVKTDVEAAKRRWQIFAC